MQNVHDDDMMLIKIINVHNVVFKYFIHLHENDTASGTIANETANPAVMAVKYCVLRVGFVKSIFLPNPLDNDLAFATIDSSCDGGISLLEDDEKRRDIPRKGVPDIATDFPLALDAVVVEEREDDDDGVPS